MRTRKASVIRVVLALLVSITFLNSGTFRGSAASKHQLPIVSNFTQRGQGALHSIGNGRIAFADSGQIYLINADGSGLTQLTQTEPSVYNSQPAISPDGRRIAFSSSKPGGSEILVVNSDGSDLQSLTSNSNSSDGEPAWSPDGRQIAFVRGFDPTSDGIANSTSCGFEIYVVSADGTGTPVRITDGSGGTDPSWSPDGTRIAYVSDRDGDFDIYSITLGSSKVDQLTQTPENEAEPTWSPDGTQIAYARGYFHASSSCGFAHTGLSDPGYQPGSDIYRMSADGRKQVRVTFTANNFDPSWSPDGTSLAFVSFRDNQSQLFILAPNHKEEYSITTSMGQKSSPSWSH
jgi:Tol biopolymer transport system component